MNAVWLFLWDRPFINFITQKKIQFLKICKACSMDTYWDELYILRIYWIKLIYMQVVESKRPFFHFAKPVTSVTFTLELRWKRKYRRKFFFLVLQNKRKNFLLRNALREPPPPPPLLRYGINERSLYPQNYTKVYYLDWYIL